MAIRYNGDVAVVLDVQHRTPGNLRAFVQATIRSIRTGKSSNIRFSSTESVELVDVSRRKLEYSYKDQDGYVFMDPATYDTETLRPELIGNAADCLTENRVVEVLYAEGKPVELELPSSVSLKVIESAEGVRGDSANNVVPGTPGNDTIQGLGGDDTLLAGSGGADHFLGGSTDGDEGNDTVDYSNVAAAISVDSLPQQGEGWGVGQIRTQFCDQLLMLRGEGNEGLRLRWQFFECRECVRKLLDQLRRSL